jgi:succinate dehydrogenase / fumarate reductase flavoprotein subunit
MVTKKKADFYKKIETDVLIIGGGLAGAWAAIRAKEKAVNVTWVDKAEPGKCGQSAFAAGDYDIYPHGEDFEALLNYWWNSQCVPKLTSRKLLEEYLKQAYCRILDMEEWGIEFEKDDKGNFVVKSGHGGVRRVLTNSAECQKKLRKVAKNNGIKIIGRTFIADLLTSDNKVVGAVGFNVVTGEPCLFQAKSIVMAGASFGLRANNFQGVGFLSGDTLAMAYRAGGELYNMEFLRGNTGHRDYNTVGMARFSGAFGGRFKNSKGEYFMKKYRPDAQYPDATTYDQFWINMSKEVKAGNGPLYFDLTVIKPEDYALSRKLLPHLFRILDQAHVDIRKEPMPWIPVGYRGFGGLVHDHDLQTTLKGMFVAGDATSGLSLGWAIFTGWKAGNRAGRYAEGQAKAIDEEQATELIKTALAPMQRKSGLTPDEVILKIQQVIVPYPVLVLKSEESLKKALQSMERIIKEDLPQIYAVDAHDTVKANEARNMALTSEIYIKASLMRTESRSFHYREEYPERNDAEWLKWICVKKEAGKMAFNLKPVLA